MNRTLMEKERSMLSGVGLGHEFWTGALETACYLVNRSLSSTLEDKSPHEVCTAEQESEDEETQNLDVRRSIQERRKIERYIPSTFFSNFALSIIDDDPRTIREVVDSEDGKLCKEAMVDEMASLDKNEVWYQVEFPAGRKPIGRKWVFKKKMNAKGKVEKYKSRLVAKGYFQLSGIDFGDIFSPIGKVASIR
eukprot:PITA_21873